jgi:effector-binding domain-containing protein
LSLKEVRMYQVVSEHRTEQPTLVLRGKVTATEIPLFLGKAYTEVAEHIGWSGLDFAGPPFARYRPLDADSSEFEIEAGFPVDRPVEGVGDVVSSTLPEGDVAVVTYIGPYAEMKPAYDAIEAWIKAQGGEAEGPAWEVYHSDADVEPDPSTWRTNIVQPYRIG